MPDATLDLVMGNRRSTPTIEDIRARRVAMVTVDHLATITGLSNQKIRNDIRNGYLDGRPGQRKHDDRRMWIVPCREAARYLTELGLL